MGFNILEVTSLESGRCCQANLSGKGISILTKTSLCYNKTWHTTKVFHLQSHLFIHLSLLFWNPWQNLQSFTSVQLVQFFQQSSQYHVIFPMLLWLVKGCWKTFQQLGNLGSARNMQHLFPLSFLTDGATNRHLQRKLCSVEVLVFFLFFQSKSVSSPYFCVFKLTLMRENYR